MTNSKEIEKWRKKLQPYLIAVQTKLYIEQKKREHLEELKEICKNGR